MKTNRNMLHVSGLILCLFTAMIAYLVHFTATDAPSVITSPYNKRTSQMASQSRRGSIISMDGEVLARTEIDDEGNEIRLYPFDEMCAHVVGYNTHGKSGLESTYNFELLASHQKLKEQLDKNIRGEKKLGDDLYITIDTRLQEAAYDALSGNRGAIVAIDPKTGAIKAMVSMPDYNPNYIDDIWETINSDSENSVLINRVTQGLYPPGSTYKTVTALGYMKDHRNNYGKFSYDCTGETIVNSVKIHCYHGEEHGTVNLEDAYAKSCNTAFVTLGSKLSLGRFVRLNEDLMFNDDIDFELPVSKSRFRLKSNSEKSQVPQTVIGQGDTLMTPFHNALIMCAVANDGVLMRPHLMNSIRSADGHIVKQYKEKEAGRLMSDEMAGNLQKMMRKVVTDGTGHALNTDEYSVAGKTGTAETGSGESHAWFVGYSNVKDPDLVVCVIVENGGTGSKVAAPKAKEVFDTYYEEVK